MKQLCNIKKWIIMFDKEKWIIKQLTFYKIRNLN